MLPATIFRQVSHHRRGLYKNLTELVCGSPGASPLASSNVINCLNRYVPASGFIRISFLDINQYRNWDVATLRMYADKKKHALHLKTLKSCDILQDVLDKKRESFIERKNVIVEDIREARHKVKERVREKMEAVIERENIWTIPNLLTMSRMALSPYIGYVIVDGNYILAISLLGVAGISDLVSSNRQDICYTYF